MPGIFQRTRRRLGRISNAPICIGAQGNVTQQQGGAGLHDCLVVLDGVELEARYEPRGGHDQGVHRDIEHTRVP